MISPVVITPFLSVFVNLYLVLGVALGSSVNVTVYSKSLSLSPAPVTLLVIIRLPSSSFEFSIVILFVSAPVLPSITTEILLPTLETTTVCSVESNL